MLSDQLMSTVGGNVTISVAVPAPQKNPRLHSCVSKLILCPCGLWLCGEFYFSSMNRNKCVDARVSALQRQSLS